MKMQKKSMIIFNLSASPQKKIKIPFSPLKSTDLDRIFITICSVKTEY